MEEAILVYMRYDRKSKCTFLAPLHPSLRTTRYLVSPTELTPVNVLQAYTPKAPINLAGCLVEKAPSNGLAEIFSAEPEKLAAVEKMMRKGEKCEN